MTDQGIGGFSAVVIIAVVIAGIARNRGHSPAIPLLAAGLLIGFLPIGPATPTNPELVLVAILAPLVFGEAMSSSIVDLRRVSRPVMVLAIGLVLFGAYVVGVTAAMIVPAMPLAVAFSLGAILAPTDAVAVASVAKQAGLPRRMVHILEGESLVNDGTALTLLRVSSTAAAAGSVTVAHAGTILVQSVLGGLVAGVIAGYLLRWVVRRARDTTVVNGLILVAPFPVYFSAERMEGSGILAVVVTALMVAHGTSSEAEYAGRLQATGLWRTITFVLQASAFFMVGIEFPHVVAELSDEDLRLLPILVPVTLLTLVAARFVFVFLMKTFGTSQDDSRHGWLVIAWSGTRGPISALAAFTLPVVLDDGTTPFPYRALIISTTLSVVVATLLLAPTIAPLARRLSLADDDDAEMVLRARTSLARAAIDRLEEIEDVAQRTGHPIPVGVIEQLREAGEDRLRMANRKLEEEQEDKSDTVRQARYSRRIAAELLHAESKELVRLRDDEGLPDTVMRSLQQDLDVRMRALSARL